MGGGGGNVSILELLFVKGLNCGREVDFIVHSDCAAVWRRDVSYVSSYSVTGFGLQSHVSWAPVGVRYPWILWWTDWQREWLGLESWVGMQNQHWTLLVDSEPVCVGNGVESEHRRKKERVCVCGRVGACVCVLFVCCPIICVKLVCVSFVCCPVICVDLICVIYCPGICVDLICVSLVCLLLNHVSMSCVCVICLLSNHACQPQRHCSHTSRFGIPTSNHTWDLFCIMALPPNVNKGRRHIVGELSSRGDAALLLSHFGGVE